MKGNAMSSQTTVDATYRSPPGLLHTALLAVLVGTSLPDASQLRKVVAETPRAFAAALMGTSLLMMSKTGDE